MRGRTIGGTMAAALLASCSLGVVDLPVEPTPAVLTIVSDVEPDPDDPSQVEVVVQASIDPGTSIDGTARRLTSDVLRVEGRSLSPDVVGDRPKPTWLVTLPYPSPGPEGVRLGLPSVQGLGLPETLRMRIRVDVTPEGTITLGDGDDLVIRADLPSNPAEHVTWSLDLRSESLPAYRMQVSGSGQWPEEIRVPRGQMPAASFPLEADLRIRWDRSLTLYELTPDERYDLVLLSIMRNRWSVESGA